MNRYVLITGGAGFIGTNVARSYLRDNQLVHIVDNLTRPGVDRNVSDLLRDYPGRVLFTEADVRDREKVKVAVTDAKAVYHFAAQVAVTTSLNDPRFDLENNLLGTINVLEAIRSNNPQIPLLLTSTNKVYGRLSGLTLRECETRYLPADARTAEHGIREDQPLEFLSPYGCSKGSADQYVLDYAHSYELRTVVFRMSCIYGPYQLGTEDQGWVAHFVRQAMRGDPITIYGDGKQVRDLLFVDDLVRAMRLAQEQDRGSTGEAFNLGGGPANSISLLELLALLRPITGEPRIQWGPERLADQRWYVSDISKARTLLHWEPEVRILEGVKTLHNWYANRISAKIRTAQVA